MTKRLRPYGSTDQAANLAKVGKGKSPLSLAARMPSPELAAKVGPQEMITARTVRVVRRNARG